MTCERGLQGFICPQGEGNTPFAFCEGACPDPCYPIPLLMAMSRQREIVDGLYSVTELSKPAQQVYLTRHNPWWVEPESQIFMLTGSAVHHVLEDGHKRITNKGDHIVEALNEVTIDTPLGPVRLRGTPDYYDVRRKILWDYKNSKSYPVRKLKNSGGLAWDSEDYFVQLNVYRTLFFPEAERLKLLCVVMGWTNQDMIRDGVRKIEEIDVPMGDMEEVREWVVRRLALFMENEQDPSTIPPCTKADMWVDKYNNPRRCAEYCAVNRVCPQYQRERK